MRNTTLNFKKLRFIPVVFALAVAIGVGAMSLWGSPKTALANDNCGCDVTFTKWLTVFPHMSGTIGGDVTGSYQGIILNAPDQSGAITVIEAIYNFDTKSPHSFSARVQVTQDNAKGTATITGTVADGWMKGGRVEGQYKVITACAQAAPQKAPA